MDYFILNVVNRRLCKTQEDTHKKRKENGNDDLKRIMPFLGSDMPGFKPFDDLHCGERHEDKHDNGKHKGKDNVQHAYIP